MTTANTIVIPPDDALNRALVEHTHPPDWVNPAPAQRYNLVVVGGGPAGLVAAAGAAGLGAKVALIERFLLGGDCLIYGCVPSKILIRAARAAHDVRSAHRFGVHIDEPPRIDFDAVMARVRAVRSGISPHDSAERFRSLGIDVFLGEGRFTGRDTIAVGDHTLRFSKACIATGARALIPEIDGLIDAGFLTNETVFNLTALPKRLVVAGGGPIGCELAQAFQRLGSQVTLIETGDQILAREDADAAEIVAASMERDGIEFVLNAAIQRIERTADSKRITVVHEGRAHTIETDELVIATGRVPHVSGLGLEAAGIEYDPRHGVSVDDALRTSNPRVFAAGDCCMALKFTHSADAAARIVIQNALFGFLPKKAKLSALTVPWCTYTDPEIAHVGLSAHAANELHIPIDTYSVPMSSVDRAVTDGGEEGLLKVHTRRATDRIVGATLVARHAGDMISEITAAMVTGAGLGALSSVIHPYPTQAEAIKKAADAYKRTKLTPAAARIIRTLMRWQR